MAGNPATRPSSRSDRIRPRFLQHRLDVPGSKRTREQIASAAFASELDELTVLRIGLDALGDDPLVDRVPHGDDRAHHFLTFVATREPAYERTVDLDLRDRQVPHTPQRRKAGAAVRDADPPALVPPMPP